jgi:DNA invertase Pin-like site-specific DNA recombinase
MELAREGPTVSSTPAVPIAYSYIRFSTLEQRRGDSLRRQTEAAAAWCERHGVRLDAARTYLDLGRSAFLGEHRANPDRYALAAFLLLVRQGDVPRGSYLLIESLDRLTREHVQAGLRLCLELLERGVRIVQLSPAEAVYDDRSDAMALVMMLMELNRGHAESKRRSDLLAPAWRRKRLRARAEGVVLTRQLPAWIEERDGKLRRVPERAAVVRRIFALAAAGYSHLRIVLKLTDEGVPAFGHREAYQDEGGRTRYRAAGGTYGTGRWGRTYVAIILSDRRAVGEWQPRVHGVKDGPPVPGYFPAAVTEAEWLAARAVAAGRRFQLHTVKGRYVDLFSGMLRDARDGHSYYATTINCGGRPARRLVNIMALEGRMPKRSFPVSTFERAVLAVLCSGGPGEIVPPAKNRAAREARALARELEQLRERATQLEAELPVGPVPPLAAALRQLEAREKDLEWRLADARVRAATPPAETWQTMRSLAASLETADDPDDARMRLQTALRRVLERIDMLVTHRGRDRFVAAQLSFRGGTRPRLVGILHRPAWAHTHPGGREHRRPGHWWVFSRPDRAGCPFDLRDPRDVARVEAGLADCILRAIANGRGPGGTRGGAGGMVANRRGQPASAAAGDWFTSRGMVSTAEITDVLGPRRW